MTEIYLIHSVDDEERVKLKLTTKKPTGMMVFTIISIFEVKELAPGFDLESIASSFTSCFYKRTQQ
jgi:hypothetical protein